VPIFGSKGQRSWSPDEKKESTKWRIYLR